MPPWGLARVETARHRHVAPVVHRLVVACEREAVEELVQRQAARRRRALDPRVRRREITAYIIMIRQQGPEDGEAHVGVDGEEERRPVRTGTVVVARDVLAQTLAQDVRRPRERNAADTVLLT